MVTYTSERVSKVSVRRSQRSQVYGFWIFIIVSFCKRRSILPKFILKKNNKPFHYYFYWVEILSLEWGWLLRGRVVMCRLADTAIQGSAAATARRHEHCGGFPQPRQRWSSGSSECGVSRYTAALGAGPHPQHPTSTPPPVNHD